MNVPRPGPPNALWKVSPAEMARYRFEPNVTAGVRLPRDLHGIVAVRQWRLMPDLRLAARFYEVQYASNVIWSDTVPAADNTNGIYAHVSPAFHLATSDFGPQKALGVVELSGRIIEHTNGVLRAECCRVLTFLVHTALASRLSQIYGVPCVAADCNTEASLKLVQWLSDGDGLRCLNWNQELMTNLQAMRILNEVNWTGPQSYRVTVIPDLLKDRGRGISPSQPELTPAASSPRSVHAGGRKIIFPGRGIVLKNATIEARYAGGVENFTREHTCTYNNDLTIADDRRYQPLAPLLAELLRVGFTLGDDFVLLHPHRCGPRSGFPWFPGVKWLKAEVVKGERMLWVG
jgi:hypothetical protein